MKNQDEKRKSYTSDAGRKNGVALTKMLHYEKESSDVH